MEPINKSERKRAFWNFLLLFVISIVIITTTIFFSVEVPFKQNDQLLKEKNTNEKDRKFSGNFTREVLSIRDMLDTINDRASKPVFLDGEIRRKISNLNLTVNDDSLLAANKTLYTNVLSTLVELADAKKVIRDEGNKDKGMGDLQAQKDELLSRQLQEAQGKITDLTQRVSEYEQREARLQQRHN